MNKLNKLIIVSLGPGDYELMTLKAQKSLFETECILISGRGKVEETKAYQIVKSLFADKYYNVDAVRMPEVVELLTTMQNKSCEWVKQAKDIINLFSEGYSNICYVTIGDVAIYSSAYYILENIKKLSKTIYEKTEVLSGISSFSYASSLVKKPLCLGNVGLFISDSGEYREEEVTHVSMKPKVRGNRLKNGLIETDVTKYYFEHLCLKGQKYFAGQVSNKPPYLSLTIDFAS